MFGREKLKELLVEVDEHIVGQAGEIVSRELAPVPSGLKKTSVYYGVRRSGKTYVLYDLYRHRRPDALYVDFEDDRLHGFALEDFDSLVKAFHDLHPGLEGKNRTFLLDEVQNVTGWERFCRRVVEKEGGTVFVTGSSSKMLPGEIHTSLRGRAWRQEVLPYSFREYLSAHGAPHTAARAAYAKARASTRSLWSQYLRWGGFPEVAAAAHESWKSRLLQDYLSAMFFRDLVERYDITNIPLLDALTDKLFSSFATRTSVTAMVRQFQGQFPFSKDLLFAYAGYFSRSMLVFEVRKLTESSYKRLRNPPKLYLVDTGLARHARSEDKGRLLENAVYLELRRRRCQVDYFDEGRECDFVIQGPDGRRSAMQVCFELGDDNRQRELNGLIAACKHLDLNEGLILTDDQEEELEHEGIGVRVAPAWKWCLLP